MNFLLAMGGTWGTLGMIAIIFVFFYFFMIRPQKKQQRRDDEMRSALQVGDEVTTIGGIIGKVVSIKEDTFVLETTKDKTKIRFLKGAIRSVDVKAADIASAIMAANEAAADEAAIEAESSIEDVVAEVAAEEAPAKKASKSKK